MFGRIGTAACPSHIYKQQKQAYHAYANTRQAMTPLARAIAAINAAMLIMVRSATATSIFPPVWL